MRQLRPESAVILSIHPIFVYRIKCGEKGTEFRKRIWDTRNEITRVYIYETTPTSAIVGYFDIADIIKSTPDDVFKKAGMFAGIDYTEYAEYAKDAETMYGIVVKHPVFFKTPIPLDKIDGKMKAPQSFLYCTDEMSAKIISAAKDGTGPASVVEWVGKEEREILDCISKYRSLWHDENRNY